MRVDLPQYIWFNCVNRYNNSENPSTLSRESSLHRTYISVDAVKIITRTGVALTSFTTVYISYGLKLNEPIIDQNNPIEAHMHTIY